MTCWQAPSLWLCTGPYGDMCIHMRIDILQAAFLWLVSRHAYWWTSLKHLQCLQNFNFGKPRRIIHFFRYLCVSITICNFIQLYLNLTVRSLSKLRPCAVKTGFVNTHVSAHVSAHASTHVDTHIDTSVDTHVDTYVNTHCSEKSIRSVLATLKAVYIRGSYYQGTPSNHGLPLPLCIWVLACCLRFKTDWPLPRVLPHIQLKK